MRVDIVPIDGVLTRVVIVNEYDDTFLCENCSSPTYHHELLAKEDTDWCMNCNDDYYRKGWSEKRLAQWAVDQMIDGKAICIVRE